MKLEHLYGPKDDEIRFIKQLKDEVAEINLTEGTQKRNFAYVKDAVEAYLILLYKRMDFGSFEDFVLGIGQTICVKEFLLQNVKAVEKKWGYLIKYNLIFGAKSIRYGEPKVIAANIKKLK